MSSIAIIDLDGKGMIVNTEKRDRAGHAIAQAKASTVSPSPAEGTKEYRSLFYSTGAFYNPDLICLDELNPGVEVALAHLEQLFDTVGILTSRPDFLKGPTEAWLREKGIWSDNRPIRCKEYAKGPDDKREQYIPTASWKASIVKEAAAFHDQVLFIDNEERNRQAVLALGLPNVAVKASLLDYIYCKDPMIL